MLSVPTPDHTPAKPRPSEVGGAKLRAFVIPVSGEAAKGLVPWDRMREVLPPHCIPEAVDVVEAFPMTAHGECLEEKWFLWEGRVSVN